MKKILPIALLMFAGLFATAWCINWFVQARNLEKTAASGFNTLDPTLGRITAEQVKASGFPFKMVLTLTNPKATIAISELMVQAHKRAMATAGNSAGVLATPAYPKSTLDYALAGTITISVNLLGDRMSITSQGNDESIFTLEGRKVALAREYSGPVKCEMQLARSFMSMGNELWKLDAALSPAELSRRLKWVQCNVPGAMTVNSDSGQVASSVGMVSMLVEHTPDATRNIFAIKSEVKDFEVFPAGDESYDAIKRALTPANEAHVPLALSLYGKQNMRLDGAFNLPDTLAQLQTQPFLIDIRDLHVGSAAGTTTGTLKIDSRSDGAKRSADFAASFTSEFTPRQGDIAKAALAQIIHEALKQPDFAETARLYTPEQVQQAAYDALPGLSDMGPITQKIAGSFSADEAGQNVTISAFEISSREYGISGHGTHSVKHGNVIPEMQAVVTCRNCDRMVDTFGNYYVRIDNLTLMVSPLTARASLPLPIEGVKALLTAVGLPSLTVKDALQFSIQLSGGAASINGKPLQELMALVQQYMTGASQAAPVAPVKTTP